MVHFRDISVSQQGYLLILDDEEQEQGTPLRIFKPLTGRFSNPWPKLSNPLHKSSWTNKINVTKSSTAWTIQSAHHRQDKDTDFLLTLSRRIAEGHAKWGRTVEFLGEFRYIRGYWEWSEDVMSRFREELHSISIYDPVYASLFTYDHNTEVVKAFCEAWCSSTNTLITSSGELSISLWDLHFLSGLPADGVFYEETVPCTRELIGTDQMEGLFLPASCKYLFHTYHLLKNGSNANSSRFVTIEDWVRLWSKKSPRYQQPPPRKGKKSTRSKMTHNPTGVFGVHEPWNSEEISLFARLGVKEKHWKEVHLAAYISCWLCAFVLPSGDANLIRPSTFKVASLMASQKKVSLAVPVLASIFKGLNTISISTEPSRARATLPFHFVYSWMACYFKTHFPLEQNFCIPKMVQFSGVGGARFYDPAEARKRIRRWDFISWSCTLLPKDEDIAYIDDGKARASERCFFMAIRSNYLVRRLDDHFIVEPYSPHRFSRQFGYYQTTPGVLNQNIRRASLEDGLKYGRICLLHESQSTATFPSVTSSMKKFSSADFKVWWDRAFRNSFEGRFIASDHLAFDDLPEQNLSRDVGSSDGKRKVTPIPISLDDSISSSVERHWKKKKNVDPSGTVENCTMDDHARMDAYASEVVKEVFGTVDDTSSQDSRALSESAYPPRFPLPSEQAKVGFVPRSGAVSEFNVKSMIDDELKVCLQKIWGKLRDKILRTQVESLSSLEDEIRNGVFRMKTLFGSDIPHLEAGVDMLFSRATTFDRARSVSHEIGESSAQQLEKVETSFRDAQSKKNEVVSRIASFEEEFAVLEKRKDELTLSLKEDRAFLQTICGEIEDFEGEIVRLKDAPLDDEALENLKTSESLLKSAQKALEDQNPFA